MKLIQCAANPYGFEMIEILAFNYDGSGHALANCDGQLDTIHPGDLVHILNLDGESLQIYKLCDSSGGVEDNTASVAAIQFALETDEGLEFLRCWNEGDFESIRKEWPEAPEDVFVGADPLLAI